ncbi:MAG: hypothetical protein ACOZIN_22450 [Myxococcota bacterium]
MAWLFAAVCVLGVSLPALAQKPVAPVSEPPPPPLVEAPPAPPEKGVQRGWSFTGAAGVGFQLLPGDQESSVGLALEGIGAYRFNEWVSLRLRLGWGLTHWERALHTIAAGNAVGQWTAGAYVSVTEWLTTGDPAWFLFKLMASMFAYTGLMLGFVVAGVLYLITPLVPTSFVEMGLAPAAHWVIGELDLYLEGGVGTMFYVDRVRNEISPGWGPLVGAGLNLGRFGAGLHVLWSPPTLNQTRTGHVYAGGATVKLGF